MQSSKREERGSGGGEGKGEKGGEGGEEGKGEGKEQLEQAPNCCRKYKD